MLRVFRAVWKVRLGNLASALAPSHITKTKQKATCLFKMDSLSEESSRATSHPTTFRGRTGRHGRHLFQSLKKEKMLNDSLGGLKK